MNRISAAIGLILVFVAAFFFFVTFTGGKVGTTVITGTSPALNFLAFLFVIIALPLGSGLAFFGLAYRRPIYAAGTAPPTYAGSSTAAKAALALAIIAIILALAAVTVFFTIPPSSTSSGSSLSNLTNKVNGIASVNATPTTVFLRVDWCNTDNTGQDRFCPSQIVVNQGDYVVILFEHNDTDAHTFTMLPVSGASGPTGYDFQINETFGAPGYTKIATPPTLNATFFANGMHNFLTNANFSSSCVNVPSSQFAKQSAAVSPTLCVLGSSLLPTSAFNGAPIAVVNPTPGLPLNSSAPGGGLVQLYDNNTVVFLEPGGNMSIAYAAAAGAVGPQFLNGETGATIGGMTWGIAAFRATTPGIFEFLCHYHVSNGMFGYLTVLPNSACSANPSSCGLK